MRMTAAEIARLVGGETVGETSAAVTGAEVDSRRLRPGDLFVALPGAHRDGHEFVPAALDVAAAALVRRDATTPPPPAGRALIRVADPLAAYHALARHDRRRRGWTVAALTGSVGKTTTKELLAALLAARFRVGASEGNRNSTLGLPAELLSQPEDVELFVAEAGMSHAGELAVLGDILRPELLLYTRLAPVHLEFFADMDGIVEAKAELIPHLCPSGTLVVNGDDPHQGSYPARTAARTVHYGAGRAARIEGLVDRALLGTRFHLVLGDDRAEVELDLPGRHQAENLLAAATAAWVLGVPAAACAEAARSLEAAPHRGRLHRRGDGVVVVDDSYNASPVATARLLELLAAVPDARRVAVLGEMYELGGITEAAHRETGRLAASACDLLVAVGGAPARAMAEAATAAGLGRVEVAEDAEQAAAWLGPRLRPGDVVLVKGSRGVGLDRTVAALTAGEAA